MIPPHPNTTTTLNRYAQMKAAGISEDDAIAFSKTDVPVHAVARAIERRERQAVAKEGRKQQLKLQEQARVLKQCMKKEQADVSRAAAKAAGACVKRIWMVVVLIFQFT